MSDRLFGGWIGFDLDATLAYHDHTTWPNIGEPIAPMVARVKAFLDAGIPVRIVTARVGAPNRGGIPTFDEDAVRKVEVWCLKHVGKVLPIQFWKDGSMIRLYDDRAVGVEPNTGRVIGDN